MAIDLIVGMDEDDDGDWATCWDFDRNDWGGGDSYCYRKSWTSNTSPWSAGQGSWWKEGAKAAAAKSAAQGEGPFAGDATIQASNWWMRSGYARSYEAAPSWNAMSAQKPAMDMPFFGDGLAANDRHTFLASNVAANSRTMLPVLPSGIPMVSVPPPPPPDLEDDEEREPARLHPWKKKSEHSEKQKKEKKEKGEAPGSGPSSPEKDGEKKPKSEKKDSKRKKNIESLRDTKDEIQAEIEVALAAPGAIIQKADFDQGVRRFLGALRGCENGQQKVKDALAMILTYTSPKQRTSVKNWPAYLLTLLKRFEPNALAKGGGKGDEKRRSRSMSELQAELLRPRKSSGSSEDPKDPEADVPLEAQKATSSSKPAKEKPEQEPAPSASAATPAVRADEVLPAGWAEGRKGLLTEVGQVLAGVNPFTGKPIDYEETFVKQMSACFADCRKGGPPMKANLWRHVQGVAGCCDLADCPRAVDAAAASKAPEFGALSEDVCSMEGAIAIGKAADKRPGGSADAVAETVFQEISLKILTDILRNPKMVPMKSAKP
eukprot:TRINITY_DN29580_c0_g2_i1.p1 TRINITY_DN29580_c0_g2~~TRINITY_DN29580_c0_g2_i1.p1  ORF type:complete len:546 (-),score=145.88 TRINITY_DN29580_c0_g2_i1:86-1723(-)